MVLCSVSEVVSGTNLQWCGSGLLMVSTECSARNVHRGYGGSVVVLRSAFAGNCHQ